MSRATGIGVGKVSITGIIRQALSFEVSDAPWPSSGPSVEGNALLGAFWGKIGDRTRGCYADRAKSAKPGQVIVSTLDWRLCGMVEHPAPGSDATIDGYPVYWNKGWRRWIGERDEQDEQTVSPLIANFLVDEFAKALAAEEDRVAFDAALKKSDE